MTTNETLHDLGFDMGTIYKESEDALVLYDTRAYSPSRMAVLSSDQMYELVTYWLDGLCPVCFTEIPERFVVCDDCLRRSLSARGL